ncbi:ATP-binding protein [Hoeflea prorocentri]|uniref:histidine kinase n=1 Tax=Hoeflea prorocentri TaxID=1922333 RepID=A0A9X3UJD8_9HYPH|nr:ATP-binding protein [Hoeflea prorocentri]MCY6381938.1 ATP-binding protein [Hoeflea prorocentri]MDA5399738.1 ATP-binding protein [Hoeflea prorocentri]
MAAKDQEHVRTFSADEKVRLVLESLRADKSVAEQCREVGVPQDIFEQWRNSFLEGGKRQLFEETAPASNSIELDDDLCRMIVESFPANLLVSRPADGKILFRSGSTEATYGKREHTSEHWACQKARRKFVEQLKETGKVDAMFFVGRKFDDTEFPAQLSSRLIEHRDTTISVTTSTDLSRFYAMTEEIEKINARFEEALEALDEGLMLYDSELRLELFNERANELFFDGKGRFELGKTFQEICDHFAKTGLLVMPPGLAKEDWARFAEQDVRSLAQNSELTTAAGRLLLGTSHKTDQGGYLLTFRDITEQRKAQEAEREADSLLKLIVDACPVNFMVSRVEDGEIVYRSQASKERFGKIDSARSFFLKPEDRLAYLDALLPTGVVNDYPVKFRKGNGSITDGLTSARVTTYKGNDVIVSSTRDVTEFLKLQEELRHQREIAHQNEKLSALGELLAGVAHELNNPLSVVVGYSMMLKEKLEDPIHRERIDRVSQAAERCARIVKTFLAMARQRPVNPEPLSLNDIIEVAADDAGVAVRSKGARIVFDLNSTLPLVDADEDQLIQVFTNLISNARHALADKGKEGILTLRTYVDDKLNRVVAEVADNGPGVPRELQSRIFEPFFTTKEAGAGTGIGLAFCHRIIDSYGGRLSLKSSPSNGARFIVRLPESARQTGSFAEPGAVGAKAGETRRILVVDDEVSVTDMLVDLLEANGCEVEARNDAQTALSLLERKSFDAILSDIRMPGLDGEAFLKKLKASHSEYDGRLAFVTGDVMSADVADFLKRSGVPHLEKPVVPGDLQALIAELCATGEGLER